MEDLNKNIIIFEYQERGGNFHYNLGDYKENTAGFRTIAHSTYPIWDEFKKLVNAAFKDEFHLEGTTYYRWKNKKYPSFEEIKRLWDAFIEVRNDIKNE